MKFQHLCRACLRIQTAKGALKQNEKSWHSGSLELDHSRRRADLQRRNLARHFLADHHARFLDRNWRDVGLGLPLDFRLDGIQLRAKTYLRFQLMNLENQPRPTLDSTIQ